MKKSLLSYKLLIILFCSFIAVSCGDDDEDIPALKNQIEYNNTRYNADIALSWDYGATGFVEGTNTHYLQEFALLDTVTKTLSTKAALDVILLSSGTSAFKPGTFEYADLSNETSEAAVEAKYRDKNIILQSAFLLDINNDKKFDEDTELFEITSGTITVSGTAPTYTIECDVQLSDKNGLKAHYSGAVIPSPIDPDIIDEDATAAMRKAPSTSTLKSFKGNGIKALKVK